jgi:hypothetical protein
MIRAPRLLCLVVLPLALTACKESRKPAETAIAQGEILPGSASDAMLPLDTTRSQPPLAPRETASGKPGKPAADSENTQAPGPAETEAASPSPAASPAATADPAAGQ